MNDELNENKNGKVKRKIKLRRIFGNKSEEYQPKHHRYTSKVKNDKKYKGVHFKKDQRKRNKFMILAPNNTKYQGKHFSKSKAKMKDEPTFSKIETEKITEIDAEMKDEPAFLEIETGKITGTEEVLWKKELSEEEIPNIFLPVPNDFEREFPILSRMFPRLSISKMGKKLLNFKMKFKRKGKNDKNIEEELAKPKHFKKDSQQEYKENFKYEVKENINKDKDNKTEEKMEQEQNSNEKEKDEER